MNRRHFALAAVAFLTRTQEAIAQECTVGFINGMLRFSPECSSLTVPGAPFGVAPPSHMVAPVVEGTTTAVQTAEERSMEQLKEERARRDNKKDRRRAP